MVVSLVLLISQRHFPKWQLSKCAISQVTTFQMCNIPSGNFPKVRLGTLRRRKLQWCRALRLVRARGPNAVAKTGWGPSAAARTDLGSCCMGNFTFGKLPLGKIPLGCCHLGKILLGKYLTSTLHSAYVY